MAELFCLERGSGGVPVVLLHGFGGSHAAWSAVTEAIGGARHLLAFDLPGHAGSLAVPAGSAAKAAGAVMAELDRRNIERVHLVGHSMGGAAAALVALHNPARVASLTLLAPGGFGPEINHRLLRRYAAAVEEGELQLLLEQFFSLDSELPAGIAVEQAREREVPGATAALRAIVETFFEGTVQKTLPLAEFGRLAMPIKVVWGGEDRVLPTRQAHRVPGRIAVHIFEGVGHMLPQEVPHEVADIVLENSR